MVQQVLDVQARHTADFQEVRQRLTTLESQVGQVIATEQIHFAQVMQRFDRHEQRLDRIERRLDLIDAPVRERERIGASARHGDTPSARDVRKSEHPSVKQQVISGE
ncbi:MAG: hypothetical protein U1E70_18895 [Acetobacteraceae bacterium]